MIKVVKIPSQVTLIREDSFSWCYSLQRIEFAEDSNLQTIEKNAFYESSIKSISIPSKLIELKEGWCQDTLNLDNITISPNNPRYSLLDEKMIIGKSSLEKTNYDCLIFCLRNAKNITIPSFIEHICSHSFSGCKSLQQITIPKDSKLKTIGSGAFSYSGIQSFRIPPSITRIEPNTFYYCPKLKRIEIPDDSNLQIICSCAFCDTPIENITIPSQLIEIEDEWCNNTLKINNIIVSKNNPRFCLFNDKMIIGKSLIEQNYYDCLVFCARDVKSVKIPSFIKYIKSCAFSGCNKLKRIEIVNDSKLQIVGNGSFSYTSIESIRIPSNVKLIEQNAFNSCKFLRKCEIPIDSKLQIIDKRLFSYSAIESLRIPPQIVCLKPFCFSNCSELKYIEIPSDSQLQIIDKRAFGYSSIESIIIPSQVTQISIDAFCNCRNLQIIELSVNSQKNIIDQVIFDESSNAIIMISLD